MITTIFQKLYFYTCCFLKLCIYTGSNILSAFQRDKVLGVTHNQGYIHILNKIIEKSFEILCKKYALIAFCDKLIKQTILLFKNKRDALFLVYRNKAESQTRYWRKLEAEQKFICNLEEIKAEYEKAAPGDETWNTFCRNQFAALYVLVHLIKTMEVSCRLFFAYFIFN